jgi:hypothetical protein
MIAHLAMLRAGLDVDRRATIQTLSIVRNHKSVVVLHDEIAAGLAPVFSGIVRFTPPP